MARVTAVNPRRRKRRTTRRRKRRTTRRRRRNPTLRVINPRNPFGNLQKLLMPAVMVSLGSILGRSLPRMLRLPVNTENQRSMASVGAGIALQMVAPGMIGKANAEHLALGAVAGGVSRFVENFLPAQLKGFGQDIDPEEINEEIRALAASGIGALGDDDDVSTFDGLGAGDEDILTF